MDAQTNQEFRDLIIWGKLLLESALSQLEAFSGNALYMKQIGIQVIIKPKEIEKND